MSRRQGTYLTIRAAAALVFVVGATLLPRGVPAGLLILAAGLIAVLSCFWTNAGGPGERAGAREQNRWFDSLQPPQGDWPPYDAAVPAPREATARPPAAS